MKVVLCEDEEEWRKALLFSLNLWANSHDITCECVSFSSPNLLLKHLLANHNDIDVVFLDISLGNEMIDGVVAAKEIRKIDEEIPLIFVTSNSFRATDGYLVNANGFLEKPIDQERLSFFLDRILKRKNNRWIQLKADGNVKNIREKEIIYAEVNNHQITYHTLEEEITMRGTMNTILSTLGSENFSQIHRSYLISIEKIDSIKSSAPYSVTLLSKTHSIELPVSRKYIKKLLELYSANLLERFI